MTKGWYGQEFIINNKGDEILLTALKHYKKRLETITKDEQVKEMGASLIGLIGQEARKNLSLVNDIIPKITSNDPAVVSQLQHDIPILEKALNCYQSDILKIEQTMKDRYNELFDEPKKLKEDLPKIKEALKKINQFY